MGILQLYQWYVEKGTFYQAIDEDPTGRQEKRYWKWSSTIKKYFVLCYVFVRNVDRSYLLRLSWI